MSYCPKCRYEYEVGMLVCPDCNETLVDKLPPDRTAAVVPDDSWIVVGGVASEIKSEMARGSLDSNNIPSMILSSTFGAFGRGLDFNLGLAGTRRAGNIIMVPREYGEQAALVLEAILGEDLIQPER